MKALLFFLAETILALLTIFAGYIYYVNHGDSLVVGIVIAIIYSLLANWLAIYCMEL